MAKKQTKIQTGENYVEEYIKLRKKFPDPIMRNRHVKLCGLLDLPLI